MKNKPTFFNKTLPLLLSKLTSFVASSDYSESAFALIVHIVCEQKVRKFSHCSSHATWCEHGTSTFLFTSPFSHEKWVRSVGITS